MSSIHCLITLLLLHSIAVEVQSSPIIRYDDLKANPVTEALSAFYNGIFNQLGLGNITDVMECYDLTSSAVQYQFFYLWAADIATAGKANAIIGTLQYFNSTGGKLYMELPLSTLNCRRNSQDYGKLCNSLGMDISTTQFVNNLQLYISSETALYYDQFLNMTSLFDSLEPYEAGTVFGNFLMNVSRNP